MRYRKPEELKEIDIEWLELVPRNWQNLRLRFLSSIDTGNKDTQDSVDDGQYPFFVRSDNVEKLDSYLFDTEAVMTSGDGAGVCEIYHHYKGKFALHQRMYAIYDFKKVTGKYIYYSMIANFKKEVMKLSAKSTVESLRMPMLKNFPVIFGSIREQEKIVSFLDRKTEAIDELIQKKEQLIERLKEKRQALITRAVTKGLDPDVSMKDSGIEWLGEIPEEWTTKDLKFIAKVHSSNVNKKSKEDEEKVELCNYTDVYYNEFITNDLEFMEATAPDSKFDRYQLEVGDVIITKDSEDPNDIAVPALVKETKESLLCGYHLALIKCKNEILGEFLFRLFQSKKYLEEFGNRSNGITRYGLGVHEIKNIEIALPSIEKQKEIIERLNKEIKRIDDIIVETRKSIPKLKEYRQSLISAAVTGKIDMRSASAEAGSAEAEYEGMASVDRDEVQVNNI